MHSEPSIAAFFLTGNNVIAWGVLLACAAMLIRALPIVIAALCYFTGTVGKLRTSSGVPPDNDGIAYFLPKTVLRITLAYTIQEFHQTLGGIAVDDDHPLFINVLIRSLQVEPRIIADEGQVYWISAASGTSLEDANVSITLADDGTLRVLNSTITDKRAEILEAAVKLSGQIAGALAAPGSPAVAVPKLLAEAAPEKDPRSKTRAKLQDALQTLYDKYLEAAAAPLESPTSIELIKARIDAVTAMLKQLAADTAIVHVDRDLTLVKTIDPSTWSDGRSTLPLPDPRQRAVNFNLDIALDRREDPAPPPTDGDWPGIVYRQPKACRTTIRFVPPHGAAQDMFDEIISYAQFGEGAVVPVRGRRWGSVVTVLESSAQTGRLIKLGRTTTSAAAGIEKLAAAGTDSLTKEIEGLKRPSPEQAEIDRIRQQVALLTARAQLQRLQTGATAPADTK